ncbi:hypothetical protein [Bradyrhizobium sp. 190]|uniref:hypothetical protein n=1 Tax=Bradyrhizobium sp. 190 TaxID=2782658 RepID=UPI001FF897EC|nr:hypothetical protein [Bradyrhizobium sp. 190]
MPVLAMDLDHSTTHPRIIADDSNWDLMDLQHRSLLNVKFEIAIDLSTPNWSFASIADASQLSTDRQAAAISKCQRRI